MKGLVQRIDTVFVEVSVKWYSEILGLTMRWNRNGYAAFTVGETSLTLVQSADSGRYRKVEQDVQGRAPGKQYEGVIPQFHASVRLYPQYLA